MTVWLTLNTMSEVTSRLLTPPSGVVRVGLVAWLVPLLLVAELLRNTGKFTMADVLSFRLKQRPVRMAAAITTLAVCFFYLLAQMAGADLLHIPYKGGGQAITDLIGGQVPVAVLGLAAVLGYPPLQAYDSSCGGVVNDPSYEGPCAGVHTPEALTHDRPPLSAIDRAMSSTDSAHRSAPSAPSTTLL